jgi:hypothetical protein
MITEHDLHKSPALIKALTGLPGAVFWELIERLEAAYPAYERHRHERSDRHRALGAGHPYRHSLVMRTLVVLVYLRLHIPQEVVAKLLGGSQAEVSRELRRLRPLLEQVLPVPAVTYRCNGATRYRSNGATNGCSERALKRGYDFAFLPPLARVD